MNAPNINNELLFTDPVNVNAVLPFGILIRDFSSPPTQTKNPKQHVCILFSDLLILGVFTHLKVFHRMLALSTSAGLLLLFQGVRTDNSIIFGYRFYTVPSFLTFLLLLLL